MDHEIITEHKRRRPFVPFRIVLRDGTVYEVHDPLHVLANHQIVAVGIDADERGLPRESEIFPPEAVERIERIGAPDEKAG